MIETRENFSRYFSVAVWHRITYDRENKPRQERGNYYDANDHNRCCCIDHRNLADQFLQWICNIKK